MQLGLKTLTLSEANYQAMLAAVGLLNIIYFQLW